MQFVFKLTILKIWYMYIRLYDYVSWIDFVDTEKLQLHCVHHFRRIRWVYSASRFSNCTRPNVRSDDLIRIEHNWIRLFLVNSHTLIIAFNHVYYKNTRLLCLVGFDFLLFSAQNIVVTEHAIIPNNPPTAIKTSWFSYSKI